MMGDDFQASQPIYYQIVQRISKQIVHNQYVAGEKLPSVRELAVGLQVNPNTIARVYSELERMGVVETRRGQGTFVTEDTFRLKRLREEQMADQIQQFVQNMLDMGFEKSEIVQVVEEYLNKL
jgi:GntR family transcriptional regulator